MSTTEIAEPLPRPAPGPLAFLRAGLPLILLGVLVLVFGLLSIEQRPVTLADGSVEQRISAPFFSPGNLLGIVQHSSWLVVCALGMSLVLVLGGLDLSVGSAVALSSTAAALTYQQSLSPVLAMAAACLTGTAVGLVNGFFIAGLRLNPFIVTLGTMGVARGLNRVLADDKHVHITQNAAGEQLPGSWLHDLLTIHQVEKSTDAAGRVQVETWLTWPWGLTMAYGLVLVLMIVLFRLTVFGRHVVAIGSNEEAARLCGVRVERTKLAVYALAGLLFGFAGVLALSYGKSGHATAQLGFELDVIAAAVIGGASLSGGVGSMLGALAGALVIKVLYNGMVTLQVHAAWQAFAIGAIILLAAVLDLLRQGRLRRPFSRGA